MYVLVYVVFVMIWKITKYATKIIWYTLVAIVAAIGLMGLLADRTIKRRRTS